MITVYKASDGKLETSDDITEGAWVRLIDPSAEEIARTVEACDVERSDLEEALDPDQVSSFEDFDDGFMLIINIPIDDPEFTYAYTTIPLSIIVGKENVITVCMRKMDSFQAYVEKKGKWFDPSKRYEFVLELLLLSAELYHRYLGELNHARHVMVRTIEDRKQTPNSELMRLHEMETTFVYFESALCGNKESIDLLKEHMGTRSIEHDAELLEDVCDETDQSIEVASIYRELLQSTRDLFSSVVDNSLNAIMKVLTGLTIVLAVPAIVTGFFGMNVEANSFPLASTAYGFSIVLIITLVVCVILAWWLHRKNYM